MKITFEGQEYDSLEAMPPDARQRYEQAMRMFSPGAAAAAAPATGAADAGALGGVMQHATGITINGRRYASVDEMPGADRQLYEAALRSLASGGGKVNLNVQVRRRGAGGVLDQDAGDRRARRLLRLVVLVISAAATWAVLRYRLTGHW